MNDYTGYAEKPKSITEFDLVEPLVWNKRSGNLIGGHQRLKILQERGDAEVEVSVVDLPERIESLKKAHNLGIQTWVSIEPRYLN